MTYTPNAGASGQDTFTYKASDGTAESAPATVTISITHAPSCDNVARRTRTATAVSVPLACTDADGDPLTRSIVDAPSKGTLGSISGGSVTYTPNAGAFGTDTFTYKANDGTGDSATATVTITISRAPTCSDVVAQDRGRHAGLGAAELHGCRRRHADALEGRATRRRARWARSRAARSPTRRTPATFGADSFTYKANDGDGDSAPATVSITITRAAGLRSGHVSTPRGTRGST